MNRRTHHNLARLALFAMLLRVAVPAGLMPAAVAGGWFLQLCPNGLAASSIAALPDHTRRHHHHHHRGDHAEPDYVRCDLGGALSSAVTLPQSFELAFAQSAGWLDAAPLFSSVRADARHAYDSRAPPRTRSSSRTT